MDFKFHDPMWVVSQVFAFFALVTMFWSFQIKDKLKMMLLLGLGTTFLSVSAALLGNWTLTVSFGIASVRNYVFCYFEWRALKERAVAKWLWYFFAGVFIFVTTGSTVVLVHIIQVETSGIWVEWMICLTLIGLIIGNVITGTNLMRLSFMANRAFNIINHWYFNNVIAVFIACMTISSNLIFYIRQFISWYRKRRLSTTAAPEAEPIVDRVVRQIHEYCDVCRDTCSCGRLKLLEDSQLADQIDHFCDVCRNTCGCGHMVVHDHE